MQNVKALQVTHAKQFGMKLSIFPYCLKIQKIYFIRVVALELLLFVFYINAILIYSDKTKALW